MAINYTSYIPRQVIDTGIPLDQAPDFQRLADLRNWSLDGDNGLTRYQYLNPSDFRYWASQKQEGGDPSQDIQKEKQGASAPKSELEQERERLRAKFQAPLHDENNAWVQSANRGRKAIDEGNALTATPAYGTYEFATRTLPSGSDNNFITYETTGEQLNDTGRQYLKSRGWTDDQLNNFDNTKFNWGFMQDLERVGGLDHTQEKYEQYLRWLEDQKRAAQQQAAQQNSYLNGGYSGDDGTYATSPSSSSSGYDMSGPSVADFSVIDNASYGNPEFQSNPYRQSTPVPNYDPFDGGRGLRYRGPDNRPDWAK